jgi:hypothetical protein
MKTSTSILAATLLATLSTVASAQSVPDCAQPQPCAAAPVAAPAPAPVPAPASVAYAEPQQQPAAQQPVGYSPTNDSEQYDDGSGWHKPVGRRFMHGFRIGWTYVAHMDKMNRIDDNGMPTSIAKEFGLKSPNMMLLGYEGFYRIVGHSWLNVLMVGNVTVAGLEQSKFIPAASGLIGFELQQSFQLGVGVNLTPDPQSPSHMIAAAGWTPMVGGIQTPVHFFIVPDTEGNHRMGATLGMSW